MKVIRKVTSILLCFVMILLLGFPKQFAYAAEDTKFRLSINYDKKEYGIKDKARITITVKNVCENSIGGVIVSCNSNDLVLKNDVESKIEIGEINPNEVKSFSIDVALSKNASGLSFFEKIYLIICNLFSKSYSFCSKPDEPNKSKEHNEFSLKFGKINAEFDVDVWYSSFSESEIKEMNYVEKSLSESENVKDSLETLKQNGLIESFAKDFGIYWFTYSNGVQGGIASEEFSDSSEIQGGSETPSQLFVDKNTLQSFNNCSISKALVLYSFNYPSDDQTYRRFFYDGNDDFSCVNIWGKKQMYTDVDDAVTVSDIKNINSSYDVVCFCGHGSIYKDSPVMCLTEKVTDKSRNIYADDLINNRIAIVQYDGEPYYWVFPSLIKDNYGNNELDGKIIFMQCCNAFGEDKREDYSFAKAFNEAGADAVIGFRNEVNSGYCRSFMKTFVEGYASGFSTGECFEKALLIDSSLFTDNKGVPIFSGNTENRIDDFSIISVNIINRTGKTIGTYDVKFKSGELINLQKTESALATLYDIDADITENINISSIKGEKYEVTALV